MIPRKKLPASLAAIAVAVVSVAAPAPLSAQQRDAIRIGDADLGGVVSGAQGPEAGVWVIAETDRSAHRTIAKIVVTDDQGRYVIPESAEGELRGLGARLRPRRLREDQSDAGQDARISRRCPRPTTTAAAQYYPAIYWYSMLQIPAKSDFPGTGRARGMPAISPSQAQWVEHIKTNGCYACHRSATRRPAPSRRTLGDFRHLRRGLGAPHPVRAGDDRR